MLKFCPMCGEELNDEKCSKCGYNTSSVKNTKKNMINNLNTKTKKNNNKWIITGLILILIIIILIGFFILTTNSNEKILTIGDLELNMTGYNYNLESNTSTNAGSVSGYVETYNVEGQGDNFKLTVMVVDDTYNIGDVGNLATTLSGNLNAVAVTKYINGKYYWIQLSFANDEHNSETYLESIIITQGSDIPNEVTATIDSNSQTSTSTSSSSSSDDDEYYTGPSGDGSIITTRNGPTEGGGYNYNGVHYDDNGIADGPAY